MLVPLSASGSSIGDILHVAPIVPVRNPAQETPPPIEPRHVLGSVDQRGIPVVGNSLFLPNIALLKIAPTPCAAASDWSNQVPYAHNSATQRPRKQRAATPPSSPISVDAPMGFVSLTKLNDDLFGVAAGEVLPHLDYINVITKVAGGEEERSLYDEESEFNYANDQQLNRVPEPELIYANSYVYFAKADPNRSNAAGVGGVSDPRLLFKKGGDQFKHDYSYPLLIGGGAPHIARVPNNASAKTLAEIKRYPSATTFNAIRRPAAAKGSAGHVSLNTQILPPQTRSPGNNVWVNADRSELSTTRFPTSAPVGRDGNRNNQTVRPPCEAASPMQSPMLHESSPMCVTPDLPLPTKSRRRLKDQLLCCCCKPSRHRGRNRLALSTSRREVVALQNVSGYRLGTNAGPSSEFSASVLSNQGCGVSIASTGSSASSLPASNFRQRCAFCQESFSPSENHRGACTERPDYVAGCLDAGSCIQAAQLFRDCCCLSTGCEEEWEDDWREESAATTASGGGGSRGGWKRRAREALICFLLPCRCCFVPARACYARRVRARRCGPRHKAVVHR